MPVPVKNGRLLTLFSLWKKLSLKSWSVLMSSKLLFNHSLALRFCSLALCLLLSSGVAKAELTQAELTQAIRDALDYYNGISDSGGEGAFITYPIDEEFWNLSQLLMRTGNSDGIGVGVQLVLQGVLSGLFDNGTFNQPFLPLILAELQRQNPQAATNLLADIFQFLDQSAATHFNESANWRQDWYEIYGSALVNLKQNLDFVTFDNWQQVGSGSPVLSVFDEPASAKLLTLLRLLQDDVIPVLQSMEGASSSQSSSLEDVKNAVDDLTLAVQGIKQDWLTLDQLETRDEERDHELEEKGEGEASAAKDSFDYESTQAENDAQREVDNYQQASEELVETQDFDFDMETENPYDEFDTLSKDATDRFKEIVGDAQDYTYSGSDDLVLLDTPALDPELFPGLGVVKYNYTLHNGLRNWSQQSRRITSWAWRLLGFVMQLVLIVRFIAGAMSGFSHSERTTSDF